MTERKRILILSETASYTELLCEAAEKLALDVALGCGDHSGTLRLDFDTRDSTLALVSFVQQTPVVAIIPAGDVTGPVAARAASMLRFPFHTPRAGDTCKDKARLIRTLEIAGVPVCAAGLESEADDSLVLFHCLMAEGRLRILAATPRDGQPIKLDSIPKDTRELAIDAMRRAIPAIGLKHGPVRASFLIDKSRPMLADVSDTYVADDYTRALRFQIPLVDQEITFEELAIRNALGLDTSRAFLKTN